MKGLLFIGVLLAISSYLHFDHLIPSLPAIEQELVHDIQSLGFGSNQAVTQENRRDQASEEVNKALQFLDQTRSHRLGIQRLPKSENVEKQTTSSGIDISSGDRRVPKADLQKAESIIEKISMPILKNTGWNSKSNQAQIVLFSSQNSYANALLKAGAGKSEISSMVTKTGGITIGTDIWIPLYNIQDSSDLANVLTHELTHVALNEQGIGDELPTWVNEGVAWNNGLAAENQVSPSKVKSEASYYNEQILQVKRNAGLLPLSASESDILQANYNVEWVDYLAVNQLIHIDGGKKFSAFLNGVARYGVEKSFSMQFEESIQSFENQYIESIK